MAVALAAAVVPYALESLAAAPIAAPVPPITSAAAVARPARRTRCAVPIARYLRLSVTVPAKPGAAQSLDFPLVLASTAETITVQDSAHVEADPSSNADAVVLRGKELDSLSDDPDDLAADLAALAGPGAGPNGGQIYIDGFTGGRLPAKSSIREVRINQNPFSAQYDRIGMGRI